MAGHGRFGSGGYSSDRSLPSGREQAARRRVAEREDTADACDGPVGTAR